MNAIGITAHLKAKRLLFLLLFVFVASSVGVDQAAAFDNTFPDQTDTSPAGGYSDQPNVFAVNTRNTYVRESNSRLRIWFPTSSTSGSISIYNGHFCDSNAYDYMETGSWGNYSNGTDITRFRVHRAGVTIASGDGSPSGDEDRFGKKNPGAGCGQVLTFNISNLNGAGQENGYYFVNLDVNYVAPSWGAMNYFRIVSSSGSRIGQVGDNSTASGHDTTQEQVDAAPEFVNYYAPFGTPCNVETAQTATVWLYDMDNAGGSGAQDPRRDVKVRVRDVTNSANEFYVNWGGPTGTTWIPQGDNVTVSKSFTAQPGRKYRLELLDVYRNNTIQWSLPYSQIYRLNCNWNLTGTARVSAPGIPAQTGTINVRRGTNATFHFAVTRGGEPAPNIDITEQWTAGFSGNIVPPWLNYDFGPNWADNHTFTIPAGATPGTDYCGRVIHSPRSSTNAAAEASNTVCANATEATVTAILNLTPDDTPTNYVEPGETVTAEAAIRNNGTSAGNIQYLHEMWYETGARDNTSDADDLARQTTGWVNRTVAAGATPVVNTYTQNTSSPPAAAAYVCSRLQVQRQAGDTSIISVGNVAKCVPIGKSPSFAVPNGSVRTGGNYGSGTCRVSLPTIASPTYDKYEHYFGVIAHKYDRDTTNPHHTYVADSVLSVGDIDNTVSMKGGIGTGADTRLHFARGPGPDMPVDAVVGGGQFYGSFQDIDGADGTINNVFGENPFKTHCLTSLFDATRYPVATGTDIVSLPAAATYALPAPVAGAKAVTLNVCGDAANKLWTITGPGGGDLVLNQGQQYIVRVMPDPDNSTCDDNPIYVKLGSNIKYTGTAATIDKLPQFVFLAGSGAGSRVSIHVDNAVTRLDGIYGNRGVNGAATFLTCAQRAGTPLSTLVAMDSNECGNRLQINGAVVLGGRLHPYRAFGHGQAGNTDPAETFNLRADTTLSDYARDHSSSQLEVVNQRELAPRF